MAVGSVWRFADWALTVDTSGSGPIYVQECMSCGDNSGAADESEGRTCGACGTRAVLGTPDSGAW